MSGSNDFRLDRYIQTSGKYRSPQIYRAMKLSGDFKTSMLDDKMACTCDCVLQIGCDTDKCTDKSNSACACDPFCPDEPPCSHIPEYNPWRDDPKWAYEQHKREREESEKCSCQTVTYDG